MYITAACVFPFRLIYNFKGIVYHCKLICYVVVYSQLYTVHKKRSYSCKERKTERERKAARRKKMGVHRFQQPTQKRPEERNMKKKGFEMKVKTCVNTDAAFQVKKLLTPRCFERGHTRGQCSVSAEQVSALFVTNIQLTC